MAIKCYAKKSFTCLLCQIVSLFMLLNSSLSQAADEVLDLSIEEQDPQFAWQQVKQGALLVDVRTSEEFAEGHLPDAVNIPYERITRVFAMRHISKDRPVVLYCRSGNRSGMANKMLIKAGYTRTYNGGGYQALNKWNKANTKID